MLAINVPTFICSTVDGHLGKFPLCCCEHFLFTGFGADVYTLLLDTRSGVASHGVGMCSALGNSAK